METWYGAYMEQEDDSWLDGVALPGWAENDAKVALVEAMRATGVLGAACRECGVKRTEAAAWLKDEEFAEAMDLAKEDAVDDSESEVRRRGMGFREVVRDKNGQLVYERHPETGEFEADHNFDLVPMYHERYDRQMLLAWLAARRPDKFGNINRHEITGKDGKEIKTTTRIILEGVEN